MSRLGSFASKTAPQAGKTLLRLTVAERGARPLAPQRAQHARWGPRRGRIARHVVGLRSVLRVSVSACSASFPKRTTESPRRFMNNAAINLFNAGLSKTGPGVLGLRRRTRCTQRQF